MTDIKDNQGQYLISTVSKRSGVKSELVRAWERRYQAVSPTRTAGGHRVYTDQDIARLKLLNEATSHGHSISRIAKYSLDDLKKLVRQEEPSSPASFQTPSTSTAAKHLAEDYVSKCFAAVIAFDARALESHFENAIVELGTQNFIEDLLNPLLTQIGERWKTGELRPVHEHMASSIIRSLTYILRNNSPCPPTAPRMVVTTPLGQLHELGALLAAIIAELKGWQVTYLGANLPAEEIAAAVKFTNATAVTISISFNTDDHVVQKEIRRL
ncbi:MAG: MerR family transcriptional regulator, partial [Gammaproteobacteria bacterium]